MTPSTIEEEVIAFVAEFTNSRAGHITPRTTLFGDLGVDGDDGDEILEAFKKRFRVDMSAVRPVHFGIEGLVPWAPLYWLVLLWRARFEKDSTPESRARMVPITIQDLIDSAKAKKWAITYENGGLTSGQSATPVKCPVSNHRPPSGVAHP